MLYLNVSERLMKKWGRTIDLYYSLHIGGLHNSIKSVNLLIEDDVINEAQGYRILYRCELTLIPMTGDRVSIIVEREDCGAGIEHCFAKAKRGIVRRIRGMSPVFANDHLSPINHTKQLG